MNYLERFGLSLKSTLAISMWVSDCIIYNVGPEKMLMLIYIYIYSVV